MSLSNDSTVTYPELAISADATSLGASVRLLLKTTMAMRLDGQFGRITPMVDLTYLTRRLGFDDESSLDYAYRNRSEEDFYERDREYNHRHRHR